MDKPDDPAKKGQEFFQMFLKAKEFTEELMRENERLRFVVANLQSSPGSAAPAGPPDDHVRELTGRIHELESRLAELEARYRKVEEENKEFADRYIEIEEQNNNLANLYVASYQLHSTLDYREVLRIVQEIVINLIGAEAFHVLMVSEKTGQLDVESSEGQSAPVASVTVGDGLIGKAAKSGENYFASQVAYREPTPFDQPVAVIPLKIKDSQPRERLPAVVREKPVYVQTLKTLPKTGTEKQWSLWAPVSSLIGAVLLVIGLVLNCQYWFTIGGDSVLVSVIFCVMGGTIDVITDALSSSAASASVHETTVVRRRCAPNSSGRSTRRSSRRV